MGERLGEGVALQGCLQWLGVWWRENARAYPWRETSEPYKILVAEVLLHRTKAEQVVPVYTVLIERYPDLHALCTADASDLSALLWPIGLRWRTRLLHKVACILDSRGGVVPDTAEELLKLPGVGQYISAAVQCFAFGKRVAVVDTNTVRLASRVFGVPKTEGSRRSRRFAELVEALLPALPPAEANWALLDLAAKVCTPRKPACTTCPLLSCCAYGTETLGLRQDADGRHQSRTARRRAT